MREIPLASTRRIWRSEQTIDVFEYLLDHGESNANRIALGEGHVNVSLSGVQKILVYLEDQNMAVELPKKGNAFPYAPSIHGVYVYLCTKVQTRRRLLQVADSWGSMLPVSLGKTRHYDAEGVLDLELASWRGITNPRDTLNRGLSRISGDPPSELRDDSIWEVRLSELLGPQNVADDRIIKWKRDPTEEYRGEELEFHITALNVVQQIGVTAAQIQRDIERWKQANEKDGDLAILYKKIKEWTRPIAVA